MEVIFQIYKKMIVKPNLIKPSEAPIIGKNNNVIIKCQVFITLKPSAVSN